MVIPLYSWFVMIGSYIRASSLCSFFFQAEDGIRDLVRSRGLGDVYKRQDQERVVDPVEDDVRVVPDLHAGQGREGTVGEFHDLSLIHI